MAFADFFKKVISTGKGLYEQAKVLAPAVFAGVRKGIVIGKEAIKVGKNVLEAIKDVPLIGKYAQNILGSQYVGKAEKALETAGHVTDVVEDRGKRVVAAFGGNANPSDNFSFPMRAR